MTKNLKILIVDDRTQPAEDARREISTSFEDDGNINVEIEISNNFDDGLNHLKSTDFDIAVLDVRRDRSENTELDDSAGISLYNEVKAVKFCPIIFYTALSFNIKDQNIPPLVTVIDKTETERLPDAIRTIVNSGVFDTRLKISAIEHDVATIMREHMWTELAPHWNEYREEAEENSIIQVLVTRLARKLGENQSENFTKHPSYRYIFPALQDRQFPGDILRLTLRSKASEWWVLLTPAGDLAHKGKADFVLLASALPLSSHEHFKKWDESRSDENPGGAKEKWNRLSKDVLRSTSRYYYLPKFRDIPDLVVDFQNVVSIPLDSYLDNYETVASLASPFVESLLTQHAHYRGRIGVPDLDLDAVKTRLLGNNDFGITP